MMKNVGIGLGVSGGLAIVGGVVLLASGPLGWGLAGGWVAVSGFIAAPVGLALALSNSNDTASIREEAPPITNVEAAKAAKAKKEQSQGDEYLKQSIALENEAENTDISDKQTDDLLDKAKKSAELAQSSYENAIESGLNDQKSEDRLELVKLRLERLKKNTLSEEDFEKAIKLSNDLGIKCNDLEEHLALTKEDSTNERPEVEVSKEKDDKREGIKAHQLEERERAKHIEEFHRQRGNAVAERKYYIEDAFESYYMSGMYEILKLRLEVVENAQIKILLPQVLEYDAKDLIDSSTFKTIQSGEFILLPLLIPSVSGMHWVGLVIHQGMEVISITYLDSENGIPPQALKEYVIQSLVMMFPRAPISFTQQIVETQRYNNCGPELVENFIYYLTGIRATQESAILSHSLLLENTLLDPEISEPQISDNNKVIRFLSNQVLSIYITSYYIALQEINIPSIICHRSDSDTSVLDINQNDNFIIFFFIENLTNVVGRISQIFGIVFSSLGDTVCSSLMNNQYIKHQVLDYVYREELSGIKDLLSKEYVKSSDRMQPLLDKNILDWTKKDFKQFKLVVHPDKSGGAEDFRMLNSFEEQLSNSINIWPLLDEGISNFKPSVHAMRLSFKAFDSLIDVARLIYNPHPDNAKKLESNIVYLYIIHSGFYDSTTVISSILDILYSTYTGEYHQAAMQADFILSYMIFSAIAGVFEPSYIEFGYSVAVTAYSGYTAISNAYSFYQECNSVNELDSEAIKAEAAGESAVH